MIPLHHLTDDDLIAVGNDYAGRLSYYVAGWDYPASADQERHAHARCRRQAAPIDAELKRRGLRTTCRALCPLGVPA